MCECWWSWRCTLLLLARWRDSLIFTQLGIDNSVQVSSSIVLHRCVPRTLSGGMHIFDWPTPFPPPSPPGSRSESGSASRFWAGSGSCSGSASKQCGSILEIKTLFLYIMIRSKKLTWTSKTAFFHHHMENFLYSLITWLPFFRIGRTGRLVAYFVVLPW